METPRGLSVLAAVVLLSACHRAGPQQVTLGEAFRYLPLPANAQALVKEGGAEAMEFIFVTPTMPDSVVAYYRRVLSADPFHLINERTVGKSVALYAEQDAGPPIWVTINPNGSEGTMVTLAGAKDKDRPDSGAGQVKTADSGRSSTLPIKKP